jgi:acetyl esterase
VVYDAAFIGFIRGAYAPSYDNWSHPHVSPIKGDLRGYPPVLMVSGTADPLVDDNRAFVARLKAAGCEHAEHLVCQDMPHGYYFFPGMFSDGDLAFAAMSAFLNKHLGSGGHRS